MDVILQEVNQGGIVTLSKALRYHWLIKAGVELFLDKCIHVITKMRNKMDFMPPSR